MLYTHINTEPTRSNLKSHPLNTSHSILGFSFPSHNNEEIEKKNVAASVRGDIRGNVRDRELPLQNSGEEAGHHHIGSGQARSRPRRRQDRRRHAAGGSRFLALQHRQDPASEPRRSRR